MAGRKGVGLSFRIHGRKKREQMANLQLGEVVREGTLGSQAMLRVSGRGGRFCGNRNKTLSSIDGIIDQLSLSETGVLL